MCAYSLYAAIMSKIYRRCTRTIIRFLLRICTRLCVRFLYRVFVFTIMCFGIGTTPTMVSTYEMGNAGADMYSIGTSAPMRLKGASFHAYENAWSVYFEHRDIDPSTVLVFSLCNVTEHPMGCTRDAGTSSGATQHTTATGELWTSTAERMLLLDCIQMLHSLQADSWHNAYIDSLSQDPEDFCQAIRATPWTVQTRTSEVASDKTGSALVRLRPPLTLVIFREDAVMRDWTSQALPSQVFGNTPDGLSGDSQSNVLISTGAQTRSLSFRVTQITKMGDRFAVRHVTHKVVLRRHVHGLLTLALRNGCTAAGLSAPASGNVYSVSVGGRARCVWNCRTDMLRVPYNAQPPTPAQLDPSRPEFAALPVKYSCISVPPSVVSVIFGFIVDTVLAPSDIGYAQELFDAIDRLSVLVKQDLTSNNLKGELIFAIRNSVYHSSFSQTLQEMLTAKCLLAGATPAQCLAAQSTVANNDYAYQRRLRRRLLIHRRLLQSPTYIAPAHVEGIFFSTEPILFAEPLVQEQTLLKLQSLVRSAVATHASVLATSDGVVLISNIADVDFQKIVSFTTPVRPKPITPPEQQPRQTPEPFTHRQHRIMTDNSSDSAAVGLTEISIGVALGVFVVLALCVARTRIQRAVGK